LVGQQFGSQAADYLKSSVHAQGADLEALAALVEEGGKQRVLDLGSGAGHVSFAAAPRAAEVVAYDLSSQMLEVVAKAANDRGFRNIRTQQGVVEKLPFEDESFDCVLTRYSAHHWRDVDAGLREAARVLKTGGTLGIVDAIASARPVFDTFLQSIELLRDPSHVRDYSRAEWDEAIARTGLRPGSVTPYVIRLEFSSWVERMRTPKVQVDAIRALQAAMSESVQRYFDIGADGSFNLEIALFEARKIVV
jgi:SAM-dependent methyltransferase